MAREGCVSPRSCSPRWVVRGTRAQRAGWERSGGEGRGRRPATRAERVSPAYVRRESRAAGWGSEWGRAEAAPPSGIRAGSLAERRVPAEVRVYLIASGGEATGLRLPVAGSASAQSRRRWALGGPCGRRAAGGGDSGGLTAAGEGPRRRLRAAHVRGPGQGLSPQAARCVGRRGARVESPPLPASPSVEPGAGMPGRLAPSSNAAWGAKEERLEVGLAGRPSEPPRSTPPGAGTRDSYGIAAWGRGGRGWVAWRLSPPSSRPQRAAEGRGCLQKSLLPPAGAPGESPRERRVSEAEGAAAATKFPGLLRGCCPGCLFARPLPAWRRQWLPNSCARSSLGRLARAKAPCARGSLRALASSISPAATSCGRTSKRTPVRGGGAGARGGGEP